MARKLSELTAAEKTKIQTRFLNGEKPKKIAADFDLTPKQVSDLANREKWTRKKTKISEEITQKIEETIVETAVEEVRTIRAKVDEFAHIVLDELLQSADKNKTFGPSFNLYLYGDAKANPYAKAVLTETLKGIMDRKDSENDSPKIIALKDVELENI